MSTPKASRRQRRSWGKRQKMRRVEADATRVLALAGQGYSVAAIASSTNLGAEVVALILDAFRAEDDVHRKENDDERKERA